MVSRFFRTALAIAVLTSIPGCDDKSGEQGAGASASPAAGASAAGGSDPAANAKAEVGHLKGFVVRRGHKDVVIPNATVQVGVNVTQTAWVDPKRIVEDVDDNAERVFVMHDFDDKKGPVPALRIRRKFPPSNDRADRYEYLRHGEFFLEQLPVGDAMIQATVGKSTQADPVTVFKQSIVENIRIEVDAAPPAN